MQAAAKYEEPFSYVDSACAFAYFNLKPTDLEGRQAQLEAAMQTREQDRENFIRIMSAIASDALLHEFRNTFFHEWHHCLQTIFYPYRYLQSWRELDIALRFLSVLRRSSEPFQLGQFSLQPEWRDTITYSSMVHGIDIKDGLLEPV